MEDVPIAGHDDASREVKEFLSQYDAPAYVRRARRVEEATTRLLAGCRRQRDEWLAMTRTRLAMLRALAGSWEALAGHLADAEQIEVLRRLEEEWQPRLRVPVEPTTSPRALRRALEDLLASIERFNRRWGEFLLTVDVTEVNALRDGYNRYYLLEKECAFRSARLAHTGFEKLPPLTRADLAALLPLLPVPAPKP